ncbi:hypothetical protein VMT65_18945 [Nocardia sp. CDC153]|uniref:hypothetical protein n=1 Tax=Nocardia sp. CDC153 TaxID=3112167 RepID=UPI002DB56487|nr:hypothetical protein [Nocardia sp. CDC153]MEC3955127.1 hypothetical protein [Nocardia sp. CDC153]
MRIRTAVATVGIALAGAAAATVSAGSAAAIQPVVAPQNGTYFGVVLNHGETQALANSPIPGWLDPIYESNGCNILDVDSRLPQDDNYVYATLPDIVNEAARDRGGVIGMAWVAPTRHCGGSFLVVEGLS